MIILKILGALLVLLGVGDLLMNRIMEVDIYREYLNFDLTSIHPLVYQYSAWAAIILGAILWSVGSAGGDDDARDETAT